MKRSTLVLVCTMVLILPFVAACPKKQPVTPAPAPEAEPAPAPEPERVSEPATPTTEGDATPDPLSGDLEEANVHAYGTGLLGDVHFDFDKYQLKQDARDRLAKNAEFMRQHSEFVLTIEGHCDERGTNEYNLALGERRANAAKEYLVSLGISGDRLKTISYGEERPVCTVSDEGCWWRNRRAHFVISGRTSG